MLPNDNVSMSVGHLDHVLIVYSSMDINNQQLDFRLSQGSVAQSCATLDPTRGSGRVGSSEKIYRKGRIGSGSIRPVAKI